MRSDAEDWAEPAIPEKWESEQQRATTSENAVPTQEMLPDPKDEPHAQEMIIGDMPHRALSCSEHYA